MARTLVQLYSSLFERDASKYLVVFCLALFLRTLPELLSGAYPIGFDTLAGYVPAVLAFPDISPMRLFGWSYSPLTIIILWFVRVLTGIDPYLLLKISGPIFYGLFNVSFCYMLSRGLGWNNKKSFFVSLVFLLQPAVLRTGWDQLREELGLVFLFVLLARTNCNVVGGVGKKPLVVVSSFLIVFSHQLVAVLLFAVVSWQLLDGLMKKSGLFLKGLIFFFPSVLVFLWQLYGQFVVSNFSDHFAPIKLPSGSNIFVFTNYFLSDPRFLGGDYWRVLSYVGSLSLYVVVPLVPLAVKGAFRDRVFAPMLVWLGVMSYSILLYPWYAFVQYWWWALLLPIPLTVYLGEGLDRLKVFANSKRFKIAVIGLILLSIVSLGYATSIIRIGYPFAYTYIPSGMVESSIPFDDIKDLFTAIAWVDENVPLNSTVIVEERMQGFAYTKLRSDILIRVSPALLRLGDTSLFADFEANNTYAIWYANNVNYTVFTWSKVAEFGTVCIFRIRQ